jgi:transcriptional regulator with XRE-family HTH domain
MLGYNEPMEKRTVADLRREFGRRVHDARRDAGLSQTELARVLGLRSGVAVGDWERGKALPKFETFLRLCEAVNQPPAYFIDGYRDRPVKDPVDRLRETFEGADAKAAQRHLELLHRLEHLPVEVGRGIAPDELRSALEHLRFEEAGETAKARLAAAGRRADPGGTPARALDESREAAAQEAFRLGWEAALGALREWLHRRGRA